MPQSGELTIEDVVLDRVVLESLEQCFRNSHASLRLVGGAVVLSWDVCNVVRRILKEVTLHDVMFYGSCVCDLASQFHGNMERQYWA